MDRRNRSGPEPTTLEAVGNQWRYALVVVQAGEEEEEEVALTEFSNTMPNKVHVDAVMDQMFPFRTWKSKNLRNMFNKD